jgi:succinate-semialdehyde dehydrogenase / glutarate-semialdehyde dehydrogenase
MSDTIVTVNPATGAELARFPVMSAEEIDAALDGAAAAQRAWAGEDFKVRAEVLRAAAALLLQRVEELAVLVTREMGKPLAESRAEVDKCAIGLEFYADNAQGFLADEVYDTSADRSWVSYEPVGVVLAVMPWNFPLWQVFRFAAPALMAGNAALLKHSPNTTGAAVACQEILSAAGLPDGLFTTLLVAEAAVPAVTERLIADPRVGAVTITGSERAGSAVGAIAGREIKKSVLELGGSDPFVVLADADLPRVAHLAVRGRFLNAGQSCISPKRFIVEAAVAEEFTRLVIDETRALTVGDPEAPGTDVGPMARRDLRDQVAAQVDAAVAAGATVHCGGAIREDLDGFSIRPPCWVMSRQGCRSTPRKCSARWPPSSPSPTPTRRSRWPTTPHSGWAPACGAPISTPRSRWGAASPPAPVSSTPWWPPMPGCRSVAPNAAAMAANWPPPGSANSSTCAPGGRRINPQPKPQPPNNPSPQPLSPTPRSYHHDRNHRRRTISPTA